jgi:hypothetical protein
MTSKPYNARNIGAKKNTNASYTKNSSLYRKYSGPPAGTVSPRIFTISPAVSGRGVWDLDVNGPLSITTEGSWTIVPSYSFAAAFNIKGAGGTNRSYNSAVGGPGGLTTATFNFISGSSYVAIVGSNASDTQTPGAYGGGGTGGSASAPGGAGGGYSGLFLNSVTQGNAILMAGGGGGAYGQDTGGPGGTNGVGGNGGGSSGVAGTGNGSGGAGTQLAGGGAGGGNGGATAGSALQGGNGGVRSTNEGCGGGGGGGYFGGGGGADGALGSGSSQCGAPGGGGSGYIGGVSGHVVSNAVTTAGSGSAAATAGTLSIT